jgi:hypothetical protein
MSALKLKDTSVEGYRKLCQELQAACSNSRSRYLLISEHDARAAVLSFHQRCLKSTNFVLHREFLEELSIGRALEYIAEKTTPFMGKPSDTLVYFLNNNLLGYLQAIGQKVTYFMDSKDGKVASIVTGDDQRAIYLRTYAESAWLMHALLTKSDEVSVVEGKDSKGEPQFTLTLKDASGVRKACKEPTTDAVVAEETKKLLRLLCSDPEKTAGYLMEDEEDRKVFLEGTGVYDAVTALGKEYYPQTNVVHRAGHAIDLLAMAPERFLHALESYKATLEVALAHRARVVTLLDGDDKRLEADHLLPWVADKLYKEPAQYLLLGDDCPGLSGLGRLILEKGLTRERLDVLIARYLRSR